MGWNDDDGELPTWAIWVIWAFVLFIAWVVYNGGVMPR